MSETLLRSNFVYLYFLLFWRLGVCCCQLSVVRPLWHEIVGDIMTLRPLHNVVLCHPYHPLYYLHISTQYYLHITADNLTMDIIQI